MASNVEDVTLDILKNIQTSISKLDERFDQLETALRRDRRNVAGMLVMMRATAGDFDERVSEIEERVAALEATAQ